MINYDDLAAQYAQHRQVHPQVFQDLIVTSGITTSSRVLEVGCGTGNYIRTLDSTTGCSCWGLDPSLGMLARAREAGSSAQFLQGRAESLPFNCTFFDLVFSVDVIHHVTGRKQAFTDAFRVLKDGGWFCTVTDSEWIIHHRRPLTAYFPETVALELERYLPISELAIWMTEIGFDDVASWTVEFPFLLEDIEPFHNKAFSSLHLISPAAFQCGIERMELDLRQGPIQCVSYYLLLWGKKQIRRRSTE